MPKYHGPFKASIGLSLSLWLGLAAPLTVFAQTDWYTLKSNGQTIGKVGIHSYPAPDNPADTVTEISHVNHFTRQGSPFEINSVGRFVESRQAHEAIRFSYRYDIDNQPLLEANGHFTPNGMDMRLLRDNTESVGKAAITPQNFLFPGGEKIKQVYRQHFQDEAGSQFRYQTLHLGVQPQVVDTEVKPLNRETLALATGEAKPVRKFELSNPNNGDHKIYEWRDEQGKLFKSQAVGAQAGLEMVYASQREVRDIDRHTVDLVETSTIISNAIPQPRITTTALYKLSPLKDPTLRLSAIFPESFNQQFVAPPNTGKTNNQPQPIYLRIQQKEPANALATFPIPYDSQYLAATPYLQVHDTELDQTALRVVGKENRAYQAARKLQQWVYQNIAYKDFSLGFATAKETFDRKQGDCTEHAVLLTSLLRSLGIPARVAIGLIYLPDEDSDLGKFVFHMWTEAYIGTPQAGEWIPLDATNPEPVPDATHIKLADSPLSAPGDLLRLTEQVATVMGKIRIEVVQALSPAQSVLKVEIKGGEIGGGVGTQAVSSLDINRFDIQTLSRQAIQHYQIDRPAAALSDDSVAGLFTRGVEAQAQGNSQLASTRFTQALAKAQHPVALYQLGERLLAVGQYRLAQQAFLQAQSQDASLAPLVTNWMDAALPQSELPAPVARQFEQAVAKQYQIPEPSGDACQQLQTLAQQDFRPFAPLYRALGQSCDNTTAISALNKALVLNDNDFQSAERLGDLYQQNQQYEMARQAYQSAIQAIAGKPFAFSKPWMTNLQGKLEIAGGLGRLAKNKKDAAGWTQLGKGLSLQKNLKEAAQAFHNALILQPGNPQALLYGYETALAQLNWPYLEKHFSTISAIAPTNAMAARLKAHYQLRIRQYKPALASIQKAIALNPNAGENYELLFQIYGRMADQATGQNTSGSQAQATTYWQQAENALKKGVASDNRLAKRTDLLLTLSNHQLNNNRPAEALNVLQQVLDENPLNGQAHCLKGKALFLSGDAPNAHNTLKTALLLLPNDPNVLASLGQVAEEEGRDALALDYYQKAYTADPGHYEAATGLQRLMNRLQISGKKPPNFVQLTPDEHDYLVQLFKLKAKILTTYSKSKQNYLNIATADTAFDVRTMAAIRKNILRLNNTYGQLAAIYKQVENLPAPPRFSQLKYHELESQRIILFLHREALTESGVYSPERLNTLATNQQQRWQTMGSLENSHYEAMQRILSQVSPTETAGIMTEAGWNPDYNSIEMQQTQQAALKTLTNANKKLPRQGNPQ